MDKNGNEIHGTPRMGTDYSKDKFQGHWHDMDTDKEKYFCWNCGKVEIPEPVKCCDGRECGCMGLPIEPPFCCEECQKEYYRKHNA